MALAAIITVVLTVFLLPPVDSETARQASGAARIRS